VKFGWAAEPKFLFTVNVYTFSLMIAICQALVIESQSVLELIIFWNSD
jgi:hypothetical protein